MPTHLLDFASTAYAADTSVAADVIMFGDASAANAPKTTTLANLAGLSAANMSVAAIPNLAATTVQAAFAEIQGDIDSLSTITGEYQGAAATLAALPTGGTVSAGDGAILTAVDGGNQPGWYVRNAGNTAWDFVIEIGAAAAVMGAASAGAAGTSGLVPQPALGQQNFVLAGDATFKDVSTLVPVMVGATAGTASVVGTVPVAAAGDENNYLRADGTWQAVSIAAETLQQTLTAGATSTLDIDFTTAAAGVILTAADAGRWRVTVANTGALVTTAA